MIQDSTSLPAAVPAPWVSYSTSSEDAKAYLPHGDEARENEILGSGQCFLKTGLLPSGWGDQLPCAQGRRWGHCWDRLGGKSTPGGAGRREASGFPGAPRPDLHPTPGSPLHPATLFMSTPLRRTEFTSSFKGTNQVVQFQPSH